MGLNNDFLMNMNLSRTEGDEAELDEFLRMIIVHEAVSPLFQPIVDLTSGTVHGYEVVSRGLSPLEMPDDMFPRAKRLGLSCDLEVLCLRMILTRLKSMHPVVRARSRFFLNMDGEGLLNAALADELSHVNLLQHDILETNLVLEITEREGDTPIKEFEASAREYLRKGFSIAISDFGWNGGSFPQVLACRPQYIKLDKAFIRNIHLDLYRQYLLKALVSFAGSVQTRLVAEGVEYWEELETLMRLGVRYVQGYLFGMPESEPLLPSVNIMSTMQDRMKKYHNSEDNTEWITTMVISSHSIEADSTTCAELSELFTQNQHLDHVVLLEKKSPIGLLTRQGFFSQTTGPYGFPLYQIQKVDPFAKRDILIVQDRMPVNVLARLAMDRTQENVYDPVLVTDEHNQYLGTVTMKALIGRSFDLELQRAIDTNPLTKLPGNRAIESWIEQGLQGEEICVVYADLDRFKEYNDCYGFLAGDEMIRLTAKVLSHAFRYGTRDPRLGHVGGDDFIVVTSSLVGDDTLQQACENFDEWKMDLFQSEHVEKGSYPAVDRRGETAEIPLVTLSLSVVHVRRVAEQTLHPAMLSQRAALLKKKVKDLSYKKRTSQFLVDRRAIPEKGEAPTAQLPVSPRKAPVGEAAAMFRATKENPYAIGVRQEEG